MFETNLLQMCVWLDIRYDFYRRELEKSGQKKTVYRKGVDGVTKIRPFTYLVENGRNIAVSPLVLKLRLIPGAFWETIGLTYVDDFEIDVGGETTTTRCLMVKPRRTLMRPARDNLLQLLSEHMELPETGDIVLGDAICQVFSEDETREFFPSVLETLPYSAWGNFRP